MDITMGKMWKGGLAGASAAKRASSVSDLGGSLDEADGMSGCVVGRAREA